MENQMVMRNKFEFYSRSIEVRLLKSLQKWISFASTSSKRPCQPCPVQQSGEKNIVSINWQMMNTKYGISKPTRQRKKTKEKKQTEKMSTDTPDINGVKILPPPPPPPPPTTNKTKLEIMTPITPTKSPLPVSNPSQSQTVNKINSTNSPPVPPSSSLLHRTSSSSSSQDISSVALISTDPLAWQKKLEEDTRRLIALQEQDRISETYNQDVTSSRKHNKHRSRKQNPIIRTVTDQGKDEDEKKGKKSSLKWSEEIAIRLAAGDSLKQTLNSEFKSGKAPVPNFPLHSLEEGTRFGIRDLLTHYGFTLLVLDFYLGLGPRSEFPVVGYDA
jgi:hypothetical protein